MGDRHHRIWTWREVLKSHQGAFSKWSAYCNSSNTGIWITWLLVAWKLLWVTHFQSNTNHTTNFIMLYLCNFDMVRKYHKVCWRRSGLAGEKITPKSILSWRFFSKGKTSLGILRQKSPRRHKSRGWHPAGPESKKRSTYFQDLSL